MARPQAWNKLTALVRAAPLVERFVATFRVEVVQIPLEFFFVFVFTAFFLIHQSSGIKGLQFSKLLGVKVVHSIMVWWPLYISPIIGDEGSTPGRVVLERFFTPLLHSR